MSKRSCSKRRSLQRGGKRQPSRAAVGAWSHTPANLASRLRGIYRRIAHQLKVDSSYVSRVARSQRRSRAIERALRRELASIVRA